MRRGELSFIDWQQCLLNLRRCYKPVKQIAAELDGTEHGLNRIARGEAGEPPFTLGLQLLNLHLEHCPDRHMALLKTGESKKPSLTARNL